MALWITKSGEEIKYKNLKDSHLLNILKYLRQRAKDGIETVTSYGYCGDDNYMTGDVDTVYGEEALEILDYGHLKEEAITRNLIN